MTIYAKDDNGFALKDTEPYIPTNEQVTNRKVYDLPEEFDQSNWVAIRLTVPLTEEEREAFTGHKISDVVGKLENRLNPEIGWLYMKGNEVFKVAVNTLSHVVTETMEENSISEA